MAATKKPAERVTWQHVGRIAGLKEAEAICKTHGFVGGRIAKRIAARRRRLEKQ